MRYRILGSLSVTDGTRDVAITAGRDRVVLSMLLLGAGRVVGVAELVDAVWGDEPPATARGQLQTCISRLRRTLPADAILSDPAGYRLRVPPGDLDAEVFAELVAEGRTRSDPAILRRALDLWRGDALAGLENRAVRAAAASLDEQCLAVEEEWAELELAAGHHRALIGDLSSLAGRFPLREGLRVHLMTALYRSGRPADALAEYRRAARTLREELGLEPGRQLRDLHEAILKGTLPDADRVTEPPVSTGPTPVRCLPRTISDFTGRRGEVERLIATIEAADAAPAVVAIDGMAGSGKTTLALHVAALVGHRYPDAHLFLDLRGHSEDQPIEPSAALLSLLRQLGVDAEKVPSELSDRVALWRTELARRLVLVIFDNVASSAQISELLPHSAGSAALVTSRRRLSGLDGVHPESLPVLTRADAVNLLARIAGDRVHAEPKAAAEVIDRCGGLPLAIRLAGARLAHRPSWRLADLSQRMDDAVLPELAAEDRTVTGAFALSFGQLDAEAQSTFRLLSVHPGELLDEHAVAAVADISRQAAGDLLDRLVDVHLLEEPERGVYRLHDLLREYSAALAAQLPEADRSAALIRVLDLELHAALATVTIPGRRNWQQRTLRWPVPMRPDLLVDLADPCARLERTRPDLATIVEVAEESDRPEYAWKLARAAWDYLWSRSYVEDIEALFTVAVRVARRLGDPSVQAIAGNYLASTHYLRGRYDEAWRSLDDCVRLAEANDDQFTLMIVLCNQFAVLGTTARHTEGAELARRILTIAHRVGDRLGAASGLFGLSISSWHLGRTDEAIRFLRLRMQLQSGEGDRNGVIETLRQLFEYRIESGRIDPVAAERRLRMLYRVTVHTGKLTAEAEVRAWLGEALRRLGRVDEAITEMRGALARLHEVGDVHAEPPVRIMLGRALLDAREPDGAIEQFRQALAVAAHAGDTFQEARARLRLGDCLAGTDPEAARAEWRKARQIFVDMDLPSRVEAEERLSRNKDHLRAMADLETMEV